MKNLRFRATLICSFFAVYHVFMHIQSIASGCIMFSGRQRCSFENSRNFEGVMNLDLMITCMWVAGAVVGWITVMEARKKPE
ncbi:hypothetical protein ACVBGC_01880 [Burkholderia stagnalis]